MEGCLQLTLTGVDVIEAKAKDPIVVDVWAEFGADLLRYLYSLCSDGG